MKIVKKTNKKNVLYCDLNIKFCCNINLNNHYFLLTNDTNILFIVFCILVFLRFSLIFYSKFALYSKK